MNNIRFQNHEISSDSPCFVIAEISANHNNKIENAKELIKLAKESGANAVKVQTYTAETMTLDCKNDFFKIKAGPWKGRTLFDLYKDASMPWEWQKELNDFSQKIGITFFSTPFDKSAVDFLEEMNVPIYKIASFELVDIPLIEYVAQKQKPIILSTGMATLEEIGLAVSTIRKVGNEQIILLKCTSNYPAIPESMNLLNIKTLRKTFNTLIGLSDHSMQNEIAVAAVVLGAKVIEKHFTLSRENPGPDSHFSMEPQEFKGMVSAIRIVESAVKDGKFGPTENENRNLVFRRSLFVTQTISKGEVFTVDNIKSIRPGNGLSPKYLPFVLNKTSSKNIERGTPLSLDMINE